MTALCRVAAVREMSMPAPPGGRRALALVSLASLGWALSFGVGGAFTLMATVLAWLVVPQRSEAEKESPEASFAWRAGLLGFGTAWVQGFLEGGMVTFLSLYLLSLGHAEAVVSALLGGLFA